ncbi:hypothetical protein QWY99_05450 [Flavobacterium branchiarum]|uniref:Uncharacterized protein n=1 Tax=Flavobacterium branchiarum TaxID=1114870 RepID=A0ABV5FJU3_9FLAO|nr:hypothetical protein [Flavobacterium branchiarum]MDN3672502.1 hypothetical protein [Flavobacterium branchiarum]
MQKENHEVSNQDVIPSMVNFLSNVWLEGDFREQPFYLQEIFEILLDTEYGNDLDLRRKMFSCLRTSRNLATALSPFSDNEIHKAFMESALKAS